MVLITIVTGANLNQLITGGPHIVDIYIQYIYIYLRLLESMSEESGP